MKRSLKKRLNLLALALMFGLIFVPAATVHAADGITGGGTAENPYIITTEEGLREFADKVNTGGELSAVAKLDADITLTGTWTPISTAPTVANQYNGTFDGNGHKISDLSISYSSANCGFFGAVNGATIKNLSLVGNISSSKGYVGGVVGKLVQGTIENCSFDGLVSTTTTGSNGYVGGIAGYSGNSNTQKGAITGCVNRGTVTGGVAGGIAGYAKYSSIENSYNTGSINGTTRSGGIAGQAQNNVTISNTYSIGTVTGSSTASDIVDFLSMSARIENSYYPQDGRAQGGTQGTVSGGGVIDKTTLTNDLGSAFIDDENNINDGYSILAWEAGGSVAPQEPEIGITGNTIMYLSNSQSGYPVEDIKALPRNFATTPEIEWSITKGNDVISLAAADEANAIKVNALKAGVAKLKATAKGTEVTAETDILVYPFITTVEWQSGNPIPDKKYSIKVHVLGGSEYDFESYPPLPNITWKYYDESTGNTGETAITGTGTEITVPEGTKGKYLYASFMFNGETKAPSTRKEIKAPTAEDEQALDDALKRYEYGVLAPECGKDTNIAQFLKDDIQKAGHSGITVEVKSVEKRSTPNGGEAAIADNGDITYFYADPTAVASSPYNNMKYGQFDVVFLVKKGDAEKELSKTVNIYWDTDRLKTYLQGVLANITWDTIKKENTVENVAMTDLALPPFSKNPDSRLIKFEWASDNTDALQVNEPTGTPDDVAYGDRIGKVTRRDSDKEAKLTATLKYTGLNSGVAWEAKALDDLKKEFAITVPKWTDDEVREQIRQELQSKLDAGLADPGLRDSSTGDPIDTGAVTGDIHFPTTKDLKVDGKTQPVTITTDDPDVIDYPRDKNDPSKPQKNAARVYVFRPEPGETAKEVNITIAITDSETGVSASKTIPVKVQPLSQEEIDAARALMAKAVAGYWDGIRAQNADKNDIRSDMHPFQEIRSTAQGGLNYAYNVNDVTGSGVVPETYVEDPDGSNDRDYRRFNLTDNRCIADDSLQLVVPDPDRDTTVTIDSYLSHSVYGEYYKKYRDAGRTELAEKYAPFYRQHASVTVRVRGKVSDDPASGSGTSEMKKTEKTVPAANKTTPLVAAGKAVGKKKVKFTWNRIPGADRYVIYMTKCGKKEVMKRVGSVSGKKLKWTSKGLEKNRCYKFRVVAQKKDGKRYTTIVKSLEGHLVTSNQNRSLTNPRKLTISRKTITLKKDNSAVIRAKVTKVKKNRKLMTKHAPKFRFISSDSKIATVSAKGKVTARSTGTCRIYVQTINGMWKTVKVTVK